MTMDIFTILELILPKSEVVISITYKWVMQKSYVLHDKIKKNCTTIGDQRDKQVGHKYQFLQNHPYTQWKIL